MEGNSPLPANALQFSRLIPDPATGRSARLSVLLFEGDNASTGENITSHHWPNGTANPSRSFSIIDDDDRSSASGCHAQALLRSILWPVTAIVLPISLLAGVLIGLVCGFRVRAVQSLFQPSGNASEAASSAYVLVDYSATRLVFLASWLSTTAPTLASFVMVLWSLPIAQDMRSASVGLDAHRLPTPYQLSLIVGVTLASTQRLRRYFEYILSSSHPRIPPVLHKAATMLTLCVLLACGVFLADTALHYYTETVPFNQYSVHPQAMHSFGRGLSDTCLSWNRTAEICFPCSVPTWSTPAEEVDAVHSEDEVFLLQQNSSRISEIRLVQAAELENAGLAILVPQTQDIPLSLDFQASTVGVSTQCSLVTGNCNMSRTGNADLDTQFNCSDGFYGILGLPPVMSDAGNGPNDPNVPPLGWKPFQNLQYGFYADPQLRQPYATGAFNSTTGDLDVSGTCVPDAKLINPVYLGVAGRFDVGGSSGSLENDPGMMKGLQNYVDFVLSCSYTTYEVNYTWFNGSIQDASFSRSPNGTLAEMYHGSQMYATVNGGPHDLELNMIHAAQQTNSTGFMREWGDLYSVKVLSSIGAYSAARPSMQEQARTVLLVAKVPTIALWALIGCSLVYVVLGLALGYAAFRSSSSNVQDLAARLSLAGLTAAAFEERDGTGKHERIIKDPDRVFSRQEDGTRRVGVEGLAQTGYILSPIVSPKATPLHSGSVLSPEMIS
jgi:hypothetical protein